MILTAGSPGRLLFPPSLKLPLQKPDEFCFKLGAGLSPTSRARLDHVLPVGIASGFRERGIGAHEVRSRGLANSITVLY